MSTEVKGHVTEKTVTEKSSTDLAAIMGKIKAGDSPLIKVMRATAKSLTASAKLNKFLSTDDFGDYIPASFRSAEGVQKIVDQIAGDGRLGIVVDVDIQRKRFSVLTEEYVNADVAIKSTWLSTFNLDAEEQEIAARQLQKYRNALMMAVRNSKPYKTLYGIE